MSEIIKETEKLVKACNISGRHSTYQLKNFVIGKELTLQSKMWKCLKEMEARYNTSKNINLSIEDAIDDLKILEIKINILEKKKVKSELNKEQKEIRIRKLSRKEMAISDSIFEMERRLKETEEEIKFFLEEYKEMEKISPLLPQDDWQVNADYWNQTFTKELQLRIMLQKPLDLELVKSILALDDNASIKIEMIGILNQIKIQQNKVNIEKNS